MGAGNTEPSERWPDSPGRGFSSPVWPDDPSFDSRRDSHDSLPVGRDRQDPLRLRLDSQDLATRRDSHSSVRSRCDSQDSSSLRRLRQDSLDSVSLRSDSHNSYRRDDSQEARLRDSHDSQPRLRLVSSDSLLRGASQQSSFSTDRQLNTAASSISRPSKGSSVRASQDSDKSSVRPDSRISR